MNRIIKSSAVAALTLVAAAVQAAPTMDANIELDTDWGNKVNGVERGFSQGGRVEFNVAGKTEKGGFVAGRASFLAKKDGTAATDDMWAQFGNASGNVKLGRFEAADLFMVGKDTIVEDSGVVGYRNVLRGRFDSNTAHAALTFNASSELSVELGLVANGKNTGIRPVVTYAANGITARVGLENGKKPNGDKVEGFGATVGADLGGIVVNGSVGYGKIAGKKSNSIGLNATMGAAGIGYIRDKDDGDKAENNIYAAYSLPLFDTGATITPAIAYSKSEGDALIKARLRVNYTF